MSTTTFMPNFMLLLQFAVLNLLGSLLYTQMITRLRTHTLTFLECTWQFTISQLFFGLFLKFLMILTSFHNHIFCYIHTFFFHLENILKNGFKHLLKPNGYKHKIKRETYTTIDSTSNYLYLCEKVRLCIRYFLFYVK